MSDEDTDGFGRRDAFLCGLGIGAFAVIFYIGIDCIAASRSVKCELCGRNSFVQVRDSHGGKYGMCDGCIRKALKIDGEGKDGK